jgi:hypothetical protein
VPDTPLPFFTRLWLAWLAFFRVLFDGRFAARVAAAHALPPANDASSKSAADTAAAAKDVTSALRLLALLQREGRFVDFLEQDVAGFGDADIGAAARVVHDGCRKALRAHATLVPIRSEEEGARLRLAQDFPFEEVKLTGNVQGKGPYDGVLRHRGWRAENLTLPELVGGRDPSILAAAEVEL